MPVIWLRISFDYIYYVAFVRWIEFWSVQTIHIWFHAIFAPGQCCCVCLAFGSTTRGWFKHSLSVWCSQRLLLPSRKTVAAAMAQAAVARQEQNRYCGMLLVFTWWCVISFAEERLDLVEIFFLDLSLRCTVRDCLKIVPDYFRLAKKLNKGKGSLQVRIDILPYPNLVM